MKIDEVLLNPKDLITMTFQPTGAEFNDSHIQALILALKKEMDRGIK